MLKTKETTIMPFKRLAGLSQSDKCRFYGVETESTSHLLSGCKKLMSEQLYTERHDSICGVIHWHICEHFTILVPEQSWKHKQNLILENEQVILTHDKMIPSSVDIANKALRPDMVLKHKTEKSALLIEVSVSNDFGSNATKIRKMTKYQDLKNEVKRTWKLKKAEIVPVIVRATGMMKKTLTGYLVLKNHSREYHYKRATSGDCQRFREDSEKSAWNETMRTKFHSLVHESLSFNKKEVEI